MLRRLIGDEAFFAGVRRFYRASRFTKAGTEDLRRAMEAEAGKPLDRFFERWIYGSTLPRLKFSYRVEGREAVLHVDQIGEIFDVPLTVTLRYADRRPEDVVIPVTDRTADVRVPLAGALRGVDIKEDGTMAEISR
jgi:aminopeptidase N